MLQDGPRPKQQINKTIFKREADLNKVENKRQPLISAD